MDGFLSSWFLVVDGELFLLQTLSVGSWPNGYAGQFRGKPPVWYFRSQRNTLRKHEGHWMQSGGPSRWRMSGTKGSAVGSSKQLLQHTSVRTSADNAPLCVSYGILISNYEVAFATIFGPRAEIPHVFRSSGFIFQIR